MTIVTRKSSACWLLALIFLGLLTSCETNREIVSELQEKEANEIIVFLDQYGIPAEKKAASTGGMAAADTGTTYSIMVPGNQAVAALAVLSRSGLPRRPSETLLNLFAKSGLVSSSQEEQIRYQEGLSTQIAGTIRKIDGVLDADVQISFPATEQTGGMPTDEEMQEDVVASVYVKHSGLLDDPNTQLVNKIKRLVAGSVVGLTFDNVTVVTDLSRYTEVAFEETPEMIAEREYESVWSVIVSRGSVGRFRSIFFSLCIIILLLALLIAWLVWKLFPLLAHGGGFRALFTTWRPLGAEERKQAQAESEEEEEEH